MLTLSLFARPFPPAQQNTTPLPARPEIVAVFKPSNDRIPGPSSRTSSNGPQLFDEMSITVGSPPPAQVNAPFSSASVKAPETRRRPKRLASGPPPETPRPLLPRAAATPAHDVPCASPKPGDGSFGSPSLKLWCGPLTPCGMTFPARSSCARSTPSSTIAKVTPRPLKKSHASNGLISVPGTPFPCPIF